MHCLRAFPSDFLSLFRAQLLRAGRAPLLPPEFPQGDGSSVLLMGGLFGRLFHGGLLRGFVHDGAGELVQIRRLGFFA